MRRKGLPPPTQFTLGDKVRLALGVLILLLGVTILLRTLPYGLNLQILIVVLAFVGFGVYRLWLGYTRLKQWNSRR